MFEKRLQEIRTRKAEIRGLLEGDTKDVKLDELETELRNLDTEQKDIERRMAIAKGINDGKIDGNPLETPNERDNKASREQRGKALKENRSITVGSSEFVTPVNTATDIKPTFNQVSSLIDSVTVKPLNGGESFQQPYEAGYGEGDYTTTSAAYKDVETVFDYADIKKTKITAYSEEPEEIQKLPNADYDTVITNGVRVSLRKKITKQILVGDGATNHIVGIFSSAATAIDSATDMSISAIDENTLDEIIFSYGGDEDVEGTAALILNKKDLKGFAKVKGIDKKRAYNIVLNGNTGTINGIPFILNSACKALSDAATAVGDYSMAYGNLANYELAVFSDMDVQRSTDYKFKEGQIAHKGVIFIGGNVVAKNGFIRVKKGA
ncbi:MAG: phage major capsid protein [Bacteroidota bacterium]|nr:phage major capsid protein [Bacteroidota bacterium]